MRLSALKNKSSLRKLWYGLSPGNRYKLRALYFLPLDTWERVTGKTHKYVPPRGAVFTGGTAGATVFIAQGEQQLELLKEYVDLQPEHHVLDIGCGLGRTAIALTGFLNDTGSYQGFDVVEKGIAWCNKGIGADYSNFQFTHVPLFNDLYTANGEKANSFVFPYPDESFDRIFNFSVFTHMGIEEIQNYLIQMKRTVKNGGSCLCTFFIYDDSNEHYIATRAGFHFPVAHDGYKLMSAETVAGNIAIHENLLLRMATKAGFENCKIIDGFWKDSVRDTGKKEYQDIVLLS